MAQSRGSVHNWFSADTFLHGGRSKTSRNLANNTYVERRSGDDIAVRLHQTDVVTFRGREEIVLDSGGWRTVTTKDRINLVLPGGVSVFSVKGVWYVGRWNDTEANAVQYADGLTLRLDLDTERWVPVEGTYPTPTEVEVLSDARKKVAKAVKGYTALLPEAAAKWAAEVTKNQEEGNGSRLSTAGDPWCCLMGVGAESDDHLWTHIREGYVFPTIVIKALEDKGYRDPGLIFFMDIRNDSGVKDLVTILGKYLRKRLDPNNTVAAQPPAQTLDRYVDMAKEALERPSDFGYFGSDEALWSSSAPTWGRNRDSENIENANFEIVWETLVEEFPDLVDLSEGRDRKDENPSGIYVFGAGHWAVGWVENIVVPVVLDSDKPVGPTNLHPAFLKICAFVDATKAYPALPGAEERASVADFEDEIRIIRQDYLVDGTDEQAKLVREYLNDEYGLSVGDAGPQTFVQVLQHFDLPLQGWLERYSIDTAGI